jgi:hypothetical protein
LESWAVGGNFLNMREPLGYLLTWRTHGTWLHGGARGCVDRQHNEYGTPVLGPNAARIAWEQNILKAPPIELDDVARRIVEGSIREHCAVRGWELHEIAVRTNHVHAIVGYAGEPPERVLASLKAWVTRGLRQAGRFASDAQIWGHHGSTRYLWTAADLNTASAYVREGQDVPR